MRVLITGGAGFIGSHLTRELVAQDHDVRILDNLTPQVHKDGPDPRALLPAEVEFILGDVRDVVLLR